MPISPTKLQNANTRKLAEQIKAAFDIQKGGSLLEAKEKPQKLVADRNF